MRITIAFLCLCSLTAVAGPLPHDELLARAGAAMERGDYAAATAALDEAQAQRPYSLFLTRNRIATRLAYGRADEALSIVGAIAARGLYLDLSAGPFAALREHPGFAALQERLAANDTPLGEARIELQSHEDGLLPEALAWDGEGWLVGSVRTGAIVRMRGEPGTVVVLDGGVFDIERRGNRLLAAVNNQLAYQSAGAAPPGAAIVEVDLPSGRTRRSVSLAGDALLGDVEVDAAGRVYASDSLTPRVVRLDPGEDVIRDLASDPRFVNLQGVALDEQRAVLFVADYLVGLFAVDPDGGEARLLANPTEAHLGGIDGLYLHRGDLIGIQNGTTPQRIVRLRLDPAGATVLQLQVLQQRLPGWNEPTHGFVAGDRFHYLATSNWPAYDDDGDLRDGAALEPLRIMSVALD